MSALFMFSIPKAPVAAGQLRDGGRCQPSQELPLQPLPAALPGAQTGSSERRVLREAHPFGVHGAEDSPPGNQVGVNLHLNRKTLLQLLSHFLGTYSTSFSRHRSFF